MENLSSSSFLYWSLVVIVLILVYHCFRFFRLITGLISYLAFLMLFLLGTLLAEVRDVFLFHNIGVLVAILYFAADMILNELFFTHL